LGFEIEIGIRDWDLRLGVEIRIGIRDWDWDLRLGF